MSQDPIERVARRLRILKSCPTHGYKGNCQTGLKCDWSKDCNLVTQEDDRAQAQWLLIWFAEQGIPIEKLLSGEMVAVPNELLEAYQLGEESLSLDRPPPPKKAETTGEPRRTK